MSEDAKQEWFVAQLKPQGLVKAEVNLARQGFQSFCPKRYESVLRAGRRMTKYAPLFPGYLFVSFDPTDTGWTSIHATRGISRLLLTDRQKPIPLSSSFMSGLLARCDAQGTIIATPDLSLGDTIKVVSGPFADTIGRIERMTDDERVQILMDLLGQTTRLSVPKTHVERL